METHFIREGKEISYSQLTEVFGQIINEKVLVELEEKQMEKLYVRTCEAAYNAMKEHLENRNFKIITPKQAMLTAFHTKLISDQSFWNDAIRRKDVILNDYDTYEREYKMDMIHYIENEYYPAMKALDVKLS